MRILVVSNMYPSDEHPEYGTFVKNFCNQLEKVGIKYSLAVMYKTNSKLKKAVLYIKFYISTFFKCLFGKYDTIYIHYPSYSAMPVLWSNRIRKCDIFTNVHGSDVVPITNNQHRMEKYTKAAIDVSRKIIVPSEYFKKTVCEKYYVEKNKIYIYPSGGINENLFYPFSKEKIKEIKHKMKIEEGKFVVGFVSRISKAKGWQTFLSAAFEVSKSRKDVVFLIVGSGEDDDLLDECVNKSEYREKFYRFSSQSQEKLAEIYNILDVYIFPTNSLSESLGLVAIEAMACGKPVIASDYAAPRYYINDSENGYKFEKDNYRQLADCIIEYMDNPNKDILVKGALQTADKYSSEKIVCELKKVFQ